MKAKANFLKTSSRDAQPGMTICEMGLLVGRTKFKIDLTQTRCLHTSADDPGESYSGTAAHWSQPRSPSSPTRQLTRAGK